MLKTVDLFSVGITLADGRSVALYLLAEPTSANLVAAAEAGNLEHEFVEVLSVASPAIPSVGGDELETPIMLAGVNLGSIVVGVGPAFVPEKRRRKPRKKPTPKAGPASASVALVETCDLETGQKATPSND